MVKSLLSVRPAEAYMETYRSGYNEPHSKCGVPSWYRGFESHRLRQTGPLDVEIPRGFNFVLFGYRWVQI